MDRYREYSETFDEFESCAQCEIEMPKALLFYCANCHEYICEQCADIYDEPDDDITIIVFCSVCGERIYPKKGGLR